MARLTPYPCCGNNQPVPNPAPPDPGDPGLIFVFDDIANAPVADPTDLDQWNALFDLPTNGGLFTLPVVTGNQVKLIGGSDIDILEAVLRENVHLISVEDQAGVIHGLGNNCFEGCSLLESFDSPSCSDFGTGGGGSCFENCAAFTTLISPNAAFFGDGCFSSCTSLVSFSSNAPVYGASCFAICTSLTDISLPNCTNLGPTTGDDSVFLIISGNTINVTVPVGIQTDGDIVYLQANNTVTLL